MLPRASTCHGFANDLDRYGRRDAASGGKLSVYIKVIYPDRLEQGVEGWARFLPPSVATVIELAITVPFSLLVVHDTRTFSLKYRVSVASGPACHLLLLVPFWLWTVLCERSTLATKTLQLLQAFIHAFPIRYWPLTWLARESERKDVIESVVEILTPRESEDAVLRRPRLKWPE